MKLHFTNHTFSLELLRTASYGLYGGSEIGEVLATAKQIKVILKADMSRGSALPRAGWCH